MHLIAQCTCIGMWQYINSNMFIICARAAYFVMHTRPQARTEIVQQLQLKLLPTMLPRLAKAITEAWKQV